MAEGGPPPLPPCQTWARVVRDGQPATAAQLPSSNRQHTPSHAAILQQMFETCVAQGIAARLEFKTVNGAVETRLICSATAASATATAKRKHGRKRPDNERRRQMREAWRMKQKSPTAATATAASTKIAAAKEAAAKDSSH